MEVKIKKLSNEAVVPKYANPGEDAGLDLVAVSKEVVDKGDYGYISYGTGLAFEIPEGHVGLVYPRSSVRNTGMILSNSVGVIDSGYRGEVSVSFKVIKDSKQYEIGEKIAQIIIVPYPQVNLVEVDELSDSSRKDGGHGSTGK